MRRLFLLAFFASAPLLASAEADDETLAQRKLAYARDQFAGHRLSLRDRPDHPFAMLPDPVMQFDNPVSQVLDGYLFLWTDRGRPAVFAKVYYNKPQLKIGRTYVSLSTGRVMMEVDGQPAWTPTEPAVTFQALPNAPAPAADARGRLLQMRTLAERFHVVDRWGKENPTDWRLRILRTPLSRYALPDEQVIDGALFGYVLSTSPEAVLLLEARETDDGPRWFYAVSRSTVFEITFFLDDEQIANYPRLESWPPTGNYFHIPEVVPDYPFLPDAGDERGARPIP